MYLSHSLLDFFYYTYTSRHLFQIKEYLKSLMSFTDSSAIFLFAPGMAIFAEKSKHPPVEQDQ
jgi:hypothetical protein